MKHTYYLYKQTTNQYVGWMDYQTLKSFGGLRLNKMMCLYYIINEKGKVINRTNIEEFFPQIFKKRKKEKKPVYRYDAIPYTSKRHSKIYRHPHYSFKKQKISNKELIEMKESYPYAKIKHKNNRLKKHDNSYIEKWYGTIRMDQKKHQNWKHSTKKKRQWRK